MEERKSILHELYVFSEWKPEPEYLQKPDSILPENISVLWRWLRFFGAKKSLMDSVTAYKARQQKWHLALGDEGKVIAVVTDNILEIRTKRSDYATIAARTTVYRDAYPQWRKLAWSPDCSFLVLAYGNGIVSFFDLTASNLFNIPIDCSRPGGLECTDNTHAVAEIIFMPLRVKDIKWNWEVLLVTYDGKLRGYLVSQTDGFKLHHTFRFDGGVGAITYNAAHSLLYVAGLPRPSVKDTASPLHAGITAWRILNDDPFYKLSVVSDNLEAQLATERFQLYVPFLSTKNLAFIVNMAVSPDSGKLVCLHCTGEVSVWRLPLLGALARWPLAAQPRHDVDSPLADRPRDPLLYYPADVEWWSDEEIILSRFNGAVTVCGIEDMINILGKKPEFLQGVPRVMAAHDGAFMALECESNVLPAKKSRRDESMEVVKVDNENEDTFVELTKELFKSVLYAVTDLETFQPKPRRITVVSRVYRLLGIKSTTPIELFTRKIESGHYADALNLAKTFDLDSDMVYQQQWRKAHVSSETIRKYLSKVSKKIWVVHQCVDRLPETLPAAEELLKFGLELTNEEILKEINKDRTENVIKNHEDIRLEDLNSYSSELLRCRHMMLFYRERLKLYEAILKCEKSSYTKDEYDRMRGGDLARSSASLAQEGRVEALACLWPVVRARRRRLAALARLPEAVRPPAYRRLLPRAGPRRARPGPRAAAAAAAARDWCAAHAFRSIWSSDWSEDVDPETEEAPGDVDAEVAAWYDMRARQIVEYSGLVSHAMALVNLAMENGVEKLDVTYHLTTLDTLLYDVNVEGITLSRLEKMTELEICDLLMSRSTESTFVADLKKYVIPFLKRFEKHSNRAHACLEGLTDLLEDISKRDLKYILQTLESNEFELDVRTRLDLVEKCLFAHKSTHPTSLAMADKVLATISMENDGSISELELQRRRTEIRELLHVCKILNGYNMDVSLSRVEELKGDQESTHTMLMKLAENMAVVGPKRSPQDWEKFLADLLEMRSVKFYFLTKNMCYEIYARALLSSGEPAAVKLVPDVMQCERDARGRERDGALAPVPYPRAVELAVAAAIDHFNAAAAIDDPSLQKARNCLLLIKDDNPVIKEELDLISALSLLQSFGLSLLPIQVRLSVDRMVFIENCLDQNPQAYLASHKLLKIAKLLRIDDDERNREAAVTLLVGERAARAGGCPAAAAAALEAARRLAELRARAPGADALLRAVAARAHADRGTRALLLAASLARCAPAALPDTLAERLSLELENIESELGDKMTLMRERRLLTYQDKYDSADDEFSDAITTPVIEKKDLVVPQTQEIPLLKNLLEAWQNKFAMSGPRAPEAEAPRVHCQEFYRSLYPEWGASRAHYSFDRFSLPAAEGARAAQAALGWLYHRACLGGRVAPEAEAEVLERCAEEFMYKDTALGVSCLLMVLREREGQRPSERERKMATGAVGVAVTLYAQLVQSNVNHLHDSVFLIKPLQLARATLKYNTATDEQMSLIRLCVEKLTKIAECDKLQTLGYSVNGMLFNADEDYRKEVIYRMARSPKNEDMALACSLAAKYDMDVLCLWVQRASNIILSSSATPTGEVAKMLTDEEMLEAFHKDKETAIRSINEEIWETIHGDDHNGLIHFFTLLKNIDDRVVAAGLTPLEHIKLLKKTKAASQELDYKLLVSQPELEELSLHLLDVMRPENVGMVTKLLRGLPAPLNIPLTVNMLYTLWLTKNFFSVSPGIASNKKWMQQYRQCASYFNKLSKDDLLAFVNNTCFSIDAVERVPAGTRNLMIMQAVDYCQQEQENDLKSVKNEMSWSQVGQELMRWGRFLDNYHSAAVQAIVENNIVDAEDIWPLIEMSHGDMDKMLTALSALVMESEIKPSTLTTLLQCLNVEIDVDEIFLEIADNYANTLSRVERLAARLAAWRPAGARALPAALRRAAALGLPPHRRVGLLCLARDNEIQDGEDLMKIISFTVDLLKTEWPDVDYASNLTDDVLQDDAGRREAFFQFMSLADTWQRKKALVDILNCWPPSTSDCDSQSLQCEFIHYLLSNTTDQKETLVLIKLLLGKPTMSEEEIKWLADNAKEEAIINIIWIALLCKSDILKNYIPKYINSYKEILLNCDIEEDLIKELLANDLFINMVPTPLYSSMINYIINNDNNQRDASNIYTIKWATSELVKANFIAEAGSLQLLSIGVPASLRGFSQTIMYCKQMFNKK